MMRTKRFLLVFLIVAILIAFVTPINTRGSSPTFSDGAKLRQQEVRTVHDSPYKKIVRLNGSDVTSNMLQLRAGGHIIGFQPDKVYLAAIDHALRVEFLGKSGVMPKTISDEQSTNNISKERSLGKVVYEDLWRGISLTYESTKEGLTESTFHISPGADVSRIRLRYNVPVEVQEDGSLKFTFKSGFMTESAPVAWQEIDSERVPVEVSFRVSGCEVGFSVGKYDPSFPLIIDPTYQWHTFYGGSQDDESHGIAVDSSGNVYVTGWSHTTWNGPSGQVPLHAHSGMEDIFILKLNTSGAYQWHTFYGGSSDNDNGLGIAVDSSGNVYVTGWSHTTWNSPSGQLPLHAYSGAYDIFILKLNASGAYQWHTFYGGHDDDLGQGIAVDGSGNVYIAGWCHSTWNGPSGELPLDAFGGARDIFILKLNASGAYQWHTFYGGSNDDEGLGIAMDGNGNVYITGWSYSTWNGPSGQLPLHARGGAYDIFILKLNASGVYQWHTFYGGSNDDEGLRIAVDGNGNVYITGKSESTWNGPSGELPLHVYSGAGDIFILKLNASGAYQWHTFYGGSNSDIGREIAVDRSGNVFVTGNSYSTWNGPDGQNPLHAYSGNWDIFILQLNASGAYQWHTFYGGSHADIGYGIALDRSGNVCVTGWSESTWWGPEGQSALHSYSGYRDIFILKLTEVGAQPKPDIKANGSDGPISVSQINPLSITISLNSGDRYGQNADWWILVSTSAGPYSYHVGNSWTPGVSTVYQGPLMDLAYAELFNISGLPTGTYTFYFVVDLNMNGNVDMDKVYYDSVDVTITP